MHSRYGKDSHVKEEAICREKMVVLPRTNRDDIVVSNLTGISNEYAALHCAVMNPKSLNEQKLIVHEKSSNSAIRPHIIGWHLNHISAGDPTIWSTLVIAMK